MLAFKGQPSTALPVEEPEPQEAPAASSIGQRAQQAPIPLNLPSRLPLIMADTTSQYCQILDSMPEPTVRLRLNRLPDSYGRLFNDSNYVHWQAAEKIGLTPLSDLASHWQLNRPLVKVESCEDYYVEPLRYSRPYMVPEGAEMLREIGHRFRDSLAARGGGAYRIKVTSVLRTPEAVSRLRRRNTNAVDSSVHQLGTTVDISYSRFVADNDTLPRSIDDLKGLLAEVLWAMRQEGKIYIKHERQQPCFHITARPREDWVIPELSNEQ
ncbi:MAG: DUF5715 family protein [Bacteroidales bacterium]|nr:DUF5715 family protein [Bacteroidales bacterium]